ncbi:Six-hairpin glycosidase-like protein [Lactarius psammicola]|nr:Six-hairpin glycosidase-like protein [Lactarius psammicola]
MRLLAFFLAFVITMTGAVGGRARRPGVFLTLIPEPEHPAYSVYYVRDAALLYHAWLNRLTTPSDGAEDSARREPLRECLDSRTRGLEETIFDRRLGELVDSVVRSTLGAPAADGRPSRAGVLIQRLVAGHRPRPPMDLLALESELPMSPYSWDLWAPPVWGGSYWTASLQYRALLSGARLGRKIGRGGSASSFEGHLLERRERFHERDHHDRRCHRWTFRYRSGASEALTVSVLNFDPSLGCDSATFQPCSERALSSLKFLIDAYREHYSVNKDIPNDRPAQYFSTFNSAEQLFDAVLTWDIIGELHVTNTTLPFFRQFDQNIKVGTYRQGSETYESLTDAIIAWAEHVLLLVSEHTPDDYILPFSINGTSGEPDGPLGSLRSLVSALGARDAYNGLIPPSWAHGGFFYKEMQNNGAELEA